MGGSQINNEHKDRLFAFIFGNEKNRAWTLNLYNAVNGTDYSNEGDIEINTMRDTVYMGMKNDVSFILGSTVNVYEQQSTFNPNMPVRQLMYTARLYDKYIHAHRLNIYGKKLIQLPVPKLITFYNGTDELEDEKVLLLSSMFPKDVVAMDSDLDVRVRMININYGRSEKLLKSCKPLFEYSWFVSAVRSNKNRMELAEAVDKAIDNMPSEFAIKSFLEENRTEVRNMCITEYNEEETMQLFREEAREEERRSIFHALVKDGVLTPQEAERRSGIPAKEFAD